MNKYIPLFYHIATLIRVVFVLILFVFVFEANAQTGSVSGYKFNDLNGDGIWDQPGEPGLSGWEIKLYPSDSTKSTRSEITNSSGAFSFINLSDGNYRLSEINQAGWVQTTPQTNQYSITISGGNSYTNQNFGNTGRGEISGWKFHDLNGNGAWDSLGGPYEPGLSGWTINITGPVTQQTQTGPGGAFLFSNLPLGQYSITETQQFGWNQTAPPGGSFSVNLSVGQHYSCVFGNTGTSSISGKVYLESGNYCTQNNGEPDLAGWTLRLDPGPRFAISKANGEYSFPSLGIGTYTVSSPSKPYWTQTCPTNNGTYTVNITGLQTVTGKNFGVYVTQYVQDLALSMSAYYPSPFTSPCCGGTMTYMLSYENMGNLPVSNPSIELNLSPHVSYISSNSYPNLAAPTLDPNNMKHLTWQIQPNPILPGTSGQIFVVVSIDCHAPSFPMLVTHAVIGPLPSDDIKSNNLPDHKVQIACSYDPNDKSVIPKGCGIEGYIPATDSLIYEVRFQNEGNAPAYMSSSEIRLIRIWIFRRSLNKEAVIPTFSRSMEEN